MDAPPPAPPIPNQYKSSLSSNLVYSVPQQYTSASLSDLHQPLPTVSGKPGPSGRSLLLDIASAQRSIETAALNSTSTFTLVNAPEVEGRAEEAQRSSRTQAACCDKDETSDPLIETSKDTLQSTESMMAFSDLAVLPSVTTNPTLKRAKGPISGTHSRNPTDPLQDRRHWSIFQRFYPDSANDVWYIQVKDYMPPLYWAGRFQSRFDQWRTEAQVAMFNPEIKPEDEGPLGQCNLDDERKATILIFMQLRDLCASVQAADSLHVCSIIMHR